MRVFLQPYDAGWPALFEAEAELLRQHLPGIACTIEHIGSTAVRGLAAKPIIDIMVGLESPADLDRLPHLLVEAENYHYISFWENIMPFRRFFIRRRAGTGNEQAVPFNLAEEPSERIPSARRLVHVHAVYREHPFYGAHLRFRDLLREDDRLTARYAALKLELTTRRWERMSDYAAAKSDFIAKALASGGRPQP